jgi:hypothetical protein
MNGQQALIPDTIRNIGPEVHQVSQIWPGNSSRAFILSSLHVPSRFSDSAKFKAMSFSLSEELASSEETAQRDTREAQSMLPLHRPLGGRSTDPFYRRRCGQERDCHETL